MSSHNFFFDSAKIFAKFNKFILENSKRVTLRSEIIVSRILFNLNLCKMNLLKVAHKTTLICLQWKHKVSLFINPALRKTNIEKQGPSVKLNETVQVI